MKGTQFTDVEYWNLKVGDEVLASDVAVMAPAGTIGVVVLEWTGFERPIVLWHNRLRETVWPIHVLKPAEVEHTFFSRPTVNELARTMVEEDPDLEGSDCSCCARKRVMLTRLQHYNIV